MNLKPVTAAPGAPKIVSRANRSAPPVYRPGTAVGTQAKAGGAGFTRPAGPPIYRPAPAAVHRTAQPLQPIVQAKRLESRPAPPVYRPAPAAQRMPLPPAKRPAPRAPAPPVHRPAPKPPAQPPMAVQMAVRRASAPAMVPRPPVPPAPPVRKHVLQRLLLTVGPVDAIIGRSASILGRRHGGHSALENYPSLALLDPYEDLILDAHGASFQQDEIPQFAASFGGTTAEALADSLVAKGFPEDYRALIYLNGCNTATQNRGQSYALRFQMAMALRNRRVRVKGNSGSSQVQEGGDTAVRPATAEGRDAYKGLNEIFDKGISLDTNMKSLRSDIKARGGVLTAEESELDREYRAAMDLIPMVVDFVHPTVFLRDREDLSPTLDLPDTLHYQSSAYLYEAIPPDKRPPLASRIATVLDAYDNRVFKWRSGNSKEARDVLRGLCASHSYEQLYVAMKWYLTAAPRPPASFVTVTAKLDAGELKDRLTEAFQPWG